jgi:hypothetical protein
MVKNRSTTPPNNPFQAYKCLDNKGFYMKTTPSKKNDKPSALSDGIGKDSLLKPKKPLLVRLHLLLHRTLSVMAKTQKSRDLLIRCSENDSASSLPAELDPASLLKVVDQQQKEVRQQIRSIWPQIQALRPQFRPAHWRPSLEPIAESIAPDQRYREVSPPSLIIPASDLVPVPGLLLKTRTQTPHLLPNMPKRDFFTSPLRLPFPLFFGRYILPMSLSSGNLFRWILALLQHLQFTAWDFWDICTHPDKHPFLFLLCVGPKRQWLCIARNSPFSFKTGGD